MANDKTILGLISGSYGGIIGLISGSYGGLSFQFDPPLIINCNEPQTRENFLHALKLYYEQTDPENKSDLVITKVINYGEPI